MAPFRTVCIGILVCDTLSGPVDVAQRRFDEIYHHYWRNTIHDDHNTKIVIKTYNVKRLEFPEEGQLDEHDIFMVTGSSKFMLIILQKNQMNDSLLLTATAAYDDSILWVRELLAFLKNLIHNHHQIKLCGEQCDLHKLRQICSSPMVILGICFGHQIVCRALDGECMPSGQWEIGPTSIDLSDIGRSIFGVDKLVNQHFLYRDMIRKVTVSFV